MTCPTALSVFFYQSSAVCTRALLAALCSPGVAATAMSAYPFHGHVPIPITQALQWAPELPLNRPQQQHGPAAVEGGTREHIVNPHHPVKVPAVSLPLCCLLIQ